MHADFFFTHDDTIAIAVNAHKVRGDESTLATIDLGDNDLTLFVTHAQLREMATKALDELRRVGAEDEATADGVPELVCDNCGRRVETDGDVSSDDPSREWWRHIDGLYSCVTLTNGKTYSLPRNAVVNGSRSVVDYLKATGLGR